MRRWFASLVGIGAVGAVWGAAGAAGAGWGALAVLGTALGAAVVWGYLRPFGALGVLPLPVRARSATVVLAIPAGGVGSVAFSAHGRRVIRAARTSDGRPVPQGSTVLVISLRRQVVIVEALRPSTTRGK